MSTWLVTGCSTGLGRALAHAVLERGDTAVVTARVASKVKVLADAYPGTALALSLDVTNPDQVARVIDEAEERFGGVDVLVNNAGYGYRAAVEEGEDDEIAQLFATNFFGAVAMIRGVLPGMRARRSGAIVNVSSIGARLTSPGSGYYSATKAALEGLSGSLRQELEPLGISVTVVEPGAFRTDFAGRSLQQTSRAALADYAETAGKRRKENDVSHGTQHGDPARAAAVIIDAVQAAVSPALLLLGEDAHDGIRRVLAAQHAELDAWEDRSRRTGFTVTT